MPITITHFPENDPALKSFVKVDPESHFPIQNLPLGIFAPAGAPPRAGSRIGDQIVDLSVLDEASLLPMSLKGFFNGPDLNAFLGLGRPAWRHLRTSLSRLLSHGEADLRDDSKLRQRALMPADAVKMHLPLRIGGYTDFYSSREHATNVGSMFRGKDNALLPNWLHIPIGYDGRASTIVVSGTDVRRPSGQIRPSDNEPPIFASTRQLDFELEVGFVVGAGNLHGQPVPVEKAQDHVAGVVLLNDWSARDIQKWEYVPLGPFLAKSFCTSISPWIVSLDALEPFRVRGCPQDPAPLPYIASSRDRIFDIDLEVELHAPGMRYPQTICATSYKHIYWDFCQQLAHHTSNGCCLRPGDLFASGTISGPDPRSYGSLLELTWAGANPIRLPDGAERRFVHDEDTVIMRGWCKGKEYMIGFGEVVGKVVA